MAVYGFADMQSRPTEFLDFHQPDPRRVSAAGPPSRRRSTRIWRRGASMGNPGPPAGLPCTRTALADAGRAIVLPPHLPQDLPLQVVQGRLFGMGQSKANQWIHVLLPWLLAALRTLGDAPARSLTDLAQRLGVTEADAATVVSHWRRNHRHRRRTSRRTGVPPFARDGRNGGSSAPKTPAEQTEC